MAWSFHAIDARLGFHTDRNRRRPVPVRVPLAPELHGLLRRRLRAAQGQARNGVLRVAPVPQCVSVRIHILRELALEAAGLDHIIEVAPRDAAPAPQRIDARLGLLLF